MPRISPARTSSERSCSTSTTLIAARAKVIHGEHNGPGLAGGALHRFGCCALRPSSCRPIAPGVLSAHGARSHAASLAQDGDAVRVLHDFAKLVCDQQDAEGAALHHGVQTSQDFVGLGRREHGGGFVQHEEARAEVEFLEDLDLLLLARRKLGDARVEIDR